MKPKTREMAVLVYLPSYAIRDFLMILVFSVFSGMDYCWLFLRAHHNMHGSLSWPPWYKANWIVTASETQLLMLT